MKFQKILAMAILFSSSIYGSFFGLSYAPKTKDLIVEDRVWEGKAMGGIKYGGSDKTSFYIDYKGGGHSTQNTTTKYHY